MSKQQDHSNLVAELSLNLRLVTAARNVLLRAKSEQQLLFARVLWRAAELRFVTYQITVGDVVLHTASTALPATLRAAQQLSKKLIADTSVPYPEGCDDNSSLVPVLTSLARQLSKVLFETHVTPRADLTQTTIEDWYVKLTFILTTLQHSSHTVKLATLGFPDYENGGQPDKLVYENLATTQIITSVHFFPIPEGWMGDQRAIVLNGNQATTTVLRPINLPADGTPAQTAHDTNTKSLLDSPPQKSKRREKRLRQRNTKRNTGNRNSAPPQLGNIEVEKIPPLKLRSYADVVRGP